MKVLCNANSGQTLTKKQLAVGNTKESRFNVTVGMEYIVFGIKVWRSTLNVLLYADYNSPGWYPIELFSITDPRLPDSWLCFLDSEEDILQALCGYKALVKDVIQKGTSYPNTHHDALLERDPNALKIFEEERLRQEAIESARAEFAENPQKREEYLLVNYGITLDELRDIVAKVGL